MKTFIAICLIITGGMLLISHGDPLHTDLFQYRHYEVTLWWSPYYWGFTFFRPPGMYDWVLMIGPIDIRG